MLVLYLGSRWLASSAENVRFASADCGAEAANRTADKLMRAFPLWLQMLSRSWLPVSTAITVASM